MGGGYYGFGFDEVICETVCEGGYDCEYGYIGGGGGQWNGNWNQPCRGYGCNGRGQQWNNKPTWAQNDGCYEICEEDCFRGGKGGKKGGFGPGYYNYYDDGPDDWGPDDYDYGPGYYSYNGFSGKGGKKGGFGGKKGGFSKGGGSFYYDDGPDDWGYGYYSSTTVAREARRVATTVAVKK